MDRTTDAETAIDPAPAAAASASGTLGVILVVFGGLILANVDPDLDLFLAIVALLFLGCGLFFTIAGAVALGIVLARR